MSIAVRVYHDVQQSEVTRDQSLLPIAYDDARGAVGVVYETLRGVERATVDHIGNLIQRMHAVGLNALYGLESFRAGDIPHVPHFGSVIERRAQHIVEHVLRQWALGHYAECLPCWCRFLDVGGDPVGAVG